MIKCKKCRTGRVFLDDFYEDVEMYEVFCVNCGGRWNIKKGSRTHKWLENTEQANHLP